MNIESAIQTANALKSVLIAQCISKPEQYNQMETLRGQLREACDSEHGFSHSHKDVERYRYDVLEQLQESLCDLVGDFCLSYVRGLTPGDVALDITTHELVRFIEPTLRGRICDLFEGRGIGIKVPENEFKEQCDKWAGLDFSDITNRLEKQYGGDYVTRRLHEQVAQELARNTGLSYYLIDDCFTPYKAGKKFTITCYSEKNNYRSLHNFGRELRFSSRQKLYSLSKGMRHVAEEMKSEDLTDAAWAIQGLTFSIERQQGYFDSRAKNEFGAGCATLFNEKLVVSMTNEAANKLIIFLRKYAGSELKSVQSQAA